MIQIVIMLLLSLSALAYLIDRDIFSNTFTFIAFWTLIVIGSSFHLYKLYDASNIVYGMVLLGCTCFFIFANISGHFKMTLYRYNILLRINKHKQYNREYSLFWNNKIANSLLFAALAIVLYRIYIMSGVLLTEGIGAARYSFDTSIQLSGFAEIFELYFAKPYLRSYLILYTIHVFKSNIKLKMILNILLLVVISYLEDGGRSVILYEFFTIFYLYKYYKKSIPPKYKRKIIIFSAVIVLVFIYATIERGSKILESFYTYYCGSLTYFSSALSNTGLFAESTVGFSSIQGLIRPVEGVLELLGIENSSYFQAADDFIMGVQYYTVHITPNNYMNYFITCFGYFFKDFGWLGIILFSSIYGALCGIVDLKLKNDSQNDLYLAVKILTFQGILFSMSIFCLAAFNYVMALIYIYIITVSAKIKVK